MDTWRPYVRLAIKVALLILDAACNARQRKKPKR